MRSPNFFPDEKEKTEEWMTRTAKNLSDIMIGVSDKYKDIECWNYYNEIDNENDFDYLTKIGTNVLPARVRHIGIQRPKINYLANRQNKRPFNFSIALADNDSIKSKQDNIAKEIFTKIKGKVQERSFILNVGLKKLEQQKQKIKEQLQQMQQVLQDPQLPPEQKQQLQQQYQAMNEKMPEITENIDQFEQNIKDEQLLNSKESQDLKQYIRYTYKDIKEELSQKLIKDLFRQLQIKRKGSQRFINQLVTGKGPIYVDQLPEESKPRFDIYPCVKVYYPVDNKYRFTHQGRWVAIEEAMSYEAIKMEFSKEPGWTPEVDAKLKQLADDFSRNNEFIHTGGKKNIDLYSGTSLLTIHGINVRSVWWKSPRKATFKISPNPYVEGKTFTHLIDNGKTVIDPSDYRYKDSKYIHKENKQVIYDANKVEKVDKTNGDTTEERWIDDIYQGVVLNREHVVGIKLKPIIIRNIDNPSEAYLPIIDRSFSDITERPYSLIWATRHLQILYKIISYQKELLIALSGVKVQLNDLAQLPPNMTREEQSYHRKLGTLYISTTDKTGKKVQTNFNQWTQLDDTMSPNIQHLDTLLNNLDLMCHKIMGINPQVMGQLEPDQLNGTMEMAKTQAEMIISSLFYDHDEVMREALEVFVNVACKYSYSKEALLNIIDDDMGIDLVKIQNDVLNKADYKFIMTDTMKEEQELKELKQLALKQAESGMLPFENMIQLYTIDSVKELEKKYVMYNEMAKDMAQAGAETKQQKLLEFEKAKISFAKEYELTAEREKTKVEEAKVELEKAKLQIEQWKVQQDNTLARYKIDKDNETKLEMHDSKREVEAGKLQESNRANKAQEELQSIKLELDAMAENIKHALTDKGLEIQKNNTVIGKKK